MAQDPALPLTDVQFVLGHALLTTTQIYLTPRKQDVIRRVLDHHAQQTRKVTERTAPPPAPGYRPETLNVLFGTGPAMTALESNPMSTARDRAHFRVRRHAVERLANHLSGRPRHGSCETANR